MVFQDFLKTEFSVENILFWKEIELFRLELSSGTMDHETKFSRVQEIYATYIIQGGSYQVNLPSEIVHRLRADLTKEVLFSCRLFLVFGGYILVCFIS